MITTFQLRAARAGIGLSLSELADKLKGAGLKVGRATLQRLEAGNAAEVPDALASTLQKIQTYYEGEGIEFLPGNGVRLKS